MCLVRKFTSYKVLGKSDFTRGIWSNFSVYKRHNVIMYKVSKSKWFGVKFKKWVFRKFTSFSEIPK